MGFPVAALGLAGSAIGALGSLFGKKGNGGSPYPQPVDPTTLPQWNPWMQSLGNERDIYNQDISSLRGLQGQISGMQAPGLTNWDELLGQSRALQDEQRNRYEREALAAEMEARTAGYGTGRDYGAAMRQSNYALGQRQQDLGVAMDLAGRKRWEAFENQNSELNRINALMGIMGQVGSTGRSISGTYQQPLAMQMQRMEQPTGYTPPAWQQAMTGLGGGLAAGANAYQSYQDTNMMRDFYSNLGNKMGVWGPGTAVGAPGTSG